MPDEEQPTPQEPHGVAGSVAGSEPAGPGSSPGGASTPTPTFPASRTPAPSILILRQWIFAESLGRLLEHARLVVCPRYGVAIRMGEGYVGDSIDKPHEDTPHLRQGTHMKRLSTDLIMDKVGMGGGVVQGDHPAWHALGHYWKSVHPLCRWGGDFLDAKGRKVGDYGHFSVETPEGRA